MLRVLQKNTAFRPLHIASALTQHAHRRDLVGQLFLPVRNVGRAICCSPTMATRAKPDQVYSSEGSQASLQE